jgi:uncharacterized protein YhaN
MHYKDRDSSREAEALQAACQREGCPICAVLQEQVARSMNTWSYEGFTDVEHRQEVMRARGFCPLHTWQLAQHNNAFQLGVVYENVLSTLVEDLEAYEKTLPEKTQRNWLMEIKHLFPSVSPAWQQDPALMYEQCAFCKIQSAIEKRLIERLVGLLQTAETMPALLSQSTGLCRAHFTQAIQYAEAHAPAQCSTLVTCQRTCIERVLSEVRELVRKHDYRFNQEAQGEEMTSWRRAAMLCAGNPGVRS